MKVYVPQKNCVFSRFFSVLPRSATYISQASSEVVSSREAVVRHPCILFQLLLLFAVGSLFNSV
jgi:hypothetical protein